MDPPCDYCDELETRLSSIVSARDLTIRDLRAALADSQRAAAKALAELTRAYQDWDHDRDAKVGKRIGNAAEILRGITQ